MEALDLLMSCQVWRAPALGKCLTFCIEQRQFSLLKQSVYTYQVVSTVLVYISIAVSTYGDIE